MKEGDEENAMKKFGMSIDITPRIAHKVIKALRLLDVEYYVAPYEADAQLAYLWLKGLVDVVFTEDSDLLAFGVKQVFFKMDPDGNGVEIDLTKLHKCKKPDFSLFTPDMFLTTCIISGCDYVDSAKGIGFVKAQKLVEKCGEIDTVSNFMLTFHSVP
jgi:exonuclease 1